MIHVPERKCNSTCNDRGACLYDGEKAQCYCNSGFSGPTCEIVGRVFFSYGSDHMTDLISDASIKCTFLLQTKTNVTTNRVTGWHTVKTPLAPMNALASQDFMETVINVQVSDPKLILLHSKLNRNRVIQLVDRRVFLAAVFLLFSRVVGLQHQHRRQQP